MKKRTVVDHDNVRTVYEDGILTSVYPVTGDGISRHYHENGTLRAEASIVGGETQGVCRAWHDNGQLHQEHTIRGGIIVGIARDWERDGTLSHEMEYLTPHAIYAKSYSSGRVRHLFLWNGKPVSRTRWMKKVQAAGVARETLVERFGKWAEPAASGAA